MKGAEFLSGVCMLAFAASGVFFLKFWKASKNSFYGLFGIACFLLASERIALFMVSGLNQPIRSEITEANSWVYLIRLSSFVLIMWAILKQNQKREI